MSDRDHVRANIEAGPENDWIKHNQDNHDNHRTMSDQTLKRKMVNMVITIKVVVEYNEYEFQMAVGVTIKYSA